MQLGGSDQWGNIVAGIDLIKSLNKAGPKEVEAAQGTGVEAYGMTIPLLTTSNGEKFGKSAGNAVWLDESRTGISDFYQVSLDILLVRVVTEMIVLPPIDGRGCRQVPPTIYPLTSRANRRDYGGTSGESTASFNERTAC